MASADAYDHGAARGPSAARVTGRLDALRLAFAERFFPRPLVTVEGLAAFVGGRAAYVAQTALYGYLKTRMGTRFPRYFEDPAYAAAIRAAAVRAFGSCAGDLTIYAVALAGDGGRLDPAASAALARRCFAAALAAGDPGAPAPELVAAFATRADRTIWANAVHGMEVFAGSAEDVIRFAPVSEAFRTLDHAIVRNSIRFRWIDVREQLARRLDAAAVCADWRAHGGG